MFANRFTAFLDACTLAGTLRRNLLLTLAEAEFFRTRLSERVLNEAEIAIQDILTERGRDNVVDRARRARLAMENAFEDAMVSDFDAFLSVCNDLPDPDDAHVVAAALKTEAAIIVTDNLRDFPSYLLEPLNIEAKSADAFIADTIALDDGRAVAAIRRMRERLKSPKLTAEQLLLKMDAVGLNETVDFLRTHIQSL